MNVMRIKDFSAMMSRESIVVCAVAVLSAYLMFVNLEYVTLWHDEGPNALMAASLVRDGTISGWDGRNLFFGVRGGSEFFGINADLNIVYPPWSALPSALGLLLFGKGEFALRFPHALLGALSLAVLYLLLRLNFPARPRLRMLAFTMFALSPIFLLYARQGRYYPDAILFTLLAFYCYQRFFRGSGVLWLCGLCIFAVLNFLNHFGGGFAAAASMAIWHVICFRRETSLRQWLQFAAAGGVVAAICGGYLFAAKILGGEVSLEYDEGFYTYTWAKRHVYLMYYYLRDLIKTGWLPLWVALWWAWFVGRSVMQSPPSPISAKNKKTGVKNAAWLAYMEDKTVRQWALMAVLMTAITSLISVQTAQNHTLADMRYLIVALPFALFMSAVCVDRVWAKNKIAGGAFLAILFFSNIAGFPLLVQGTLCTGDLFSNYSVAEKFPLPALVRSLHRPYPTATAEITAYLREHAAQDDTIIVNQPENSPVLMYYLSDKLIFCCGLSKDASLPKDKIRALGVPLYESDAKPLWIIDMVDPATPRGYHKVYTGEEVSYPVHRPELEFHCLGESSLEIRANIFRRRGF